MPLGNGFCPKEVDQGGLVWEEVLFMAGVRAKTPGVLFVRWDWASLHVACSLSGDPVPLLGFSSLTT